MSWWQDRPWLPRKGYRPLKTVPRRRGQREIRDRAGVSTDRDAQRDDAPADHLPALAEPLPHAEIAESPVDLLTHVASVDPHRDRDDDIVADRAPHQVARCNRSQLDVSGTIVLEIGRLGRR